MREIILGLADCVYNRVSGVLGELDLRRVRGRSPAGDPQFDVDALAEEAVVEYCSQLSTPVALLTEDGGLLELGEAPEMVLIVDPIDGTRSAAAGLEGCCVSIAAAPFSPTARIRDVRHALLKELRGGAYLYADDSTFEAHGYDRPVPDLSRTTDIDRMFWSLEFNGHPAELMIESYGHLIDRSASTGGVFIFNSACYSISRLITGQLDAYVDIGNRLLRDRPDLLPRFLDAGQGSVLHLFPYDIAAAVFLADKAGVKITDAYGGSLGETLLLDTSVENQRSCLAACTPELHAELLAGIRWHSTLLEVES